MPPPPVCGAPVTTGVGDTVALGVGVGVGAWVTVAVGVAVEVRTTVAVGRTVTFGVRVTVGVAGADVSPVAVGWTEPPAVGVNVVADASGGFGVEQPDTAAIPRMAMAPMPTAVSGARGVRTLFRYPSEQL